MTAQQYFDDLFLLCAGLVIVCFALVGIHLVLKLIDKLACKTRYKMKQGYFR